MLTDIYIGQNHEIIPLCAVVVRVVYVYILHSESEASRKVLLHVNGHTNTIINSIEYYIEMMSKEVEP